MRSDEPRLEIAGSTGDLVSIALVERGLAAYAAGDVRLHVVVRAIGFTGDYDGVWIGATTVTTFLAQLEALERDRHGAAALTSMSPDDFLLQVRTVDSVGHVTVAGFLGRTYRAAHRAIEARVEFELDLEPDRLPWLLEQTRRLLVARPG